MHFIQERTGRFDRREIGDVRLRGGESGVYVPEKIRKLKARKRDFQPFEETIVKTD